MKNNRLENNIQSTNKSNRDKLSSILAKVTKLHTDQA